MKLINFIKKIDKIEGLKILSLVSKCKSNNWLNVLIINKRKYGLEK